MNDRPKARDFAEVVRDFVEVKSTDDRPPIKLGAKNLAKLDRIRRLAQKLRQGSQTATHF
jgi:hypothetical protein